jgi:hypothetical protein
MFIPYSSFALSSACNGYAVNHPVAAHKIEPIVHINRGAAMAGHHVRLVANFSRNSIYGTVLLAEIYYLIRILNKIRLALIHAE